MIMIRPKGKAKKIAEMVMKGQAIDIKPGKKPSKKSIPKESTLQH